MGKDAVREADEVQVFCRDAAKQVRGLETRLRTLLASQQPEGELLLLQDAVTSSIRIAAEILDAGHHRRHSALLTYRPLLRALRPLDARDE